MAGKERTMVTEYTGELKTGDLIGIGSSWSSSIYPAFYLGRGQGESMQFYTLIQLIAWIERTLEDKVRWRKLYKVHINHPYPERIVKLSPDLLTDEYKEKYDRAIDLLKELKVIS